MLQTLLTISILFCKNVKQVKTAFNSDNYRVVRHTIFWNTVYTGYDTRCYFNVRSKADTSQLNLPHGTNS